MLVEEGLLFYTWFSFVKAERTDLWSNTQFRYVLFNINPQNYTVRNLSQYACVFLSKSKLMYLIIVHAQPWASVDAGGTSFSITHPQNS